MRSRTPIRSGRSVPYLGKPAVDPAPDVEWLPLAEGMSETPFIFRYLNFILRFCPTNPSEVELMDRFAKLGIGAGKKLDAAALTPAMKEAIVGGIKEVWQEDFPEFMKKVNSGEVTSGDLFGTRDFLKNNYLYRLAGAKLGLYGNSREEALYPSYFVDANQEKLDASRHSYVFRFEKDKLPPAGAFWSLTMYDGKTQYLVANPLDRYLLNSTRLDDFKFDADGSLTFHIRKTSPGAEKEANWLPAPDGPFYCILRIYMPGPAVFNGQWEKPQMKVAD